MSRPSTRQMRFLTSLSRRRRVQIALAASLIIHLLVISAYQRWATDEQLLRPVRLEPVTTIEEPDRFRPPMPGRLPQAAMERLMERLKKSTFCYGGPLPTRDELHERDGRI